MTNKTHRRVHLPRVARRRWKSNEWTDEAGNLHLTLTDDDGAVVAEMIFDDGEGEDGGPPG